MSTENVFGGNITAQDIDCDNVTVTSTIDVDSLQVATAIVTPQVTSFNSVGTGVAGQAFNAGATAGTAGGATGGVGGAASFKGGGGGTGTANGGNGGAVTVGGGNAGVGTATLGGTGGAAIYSGGNGGLGGANGGAGGALTLTSGTGGVGTATAGGAGGTVALSAGAGGNGGTLGGAGGNVNISAGAAGTGGNVNGGSVVLAPGAASGAGIPGQVVVTGLQTKSASSSAIAGARVLTVQDAGGIFTVSQAAAYNITLPSPATVGAGLRFTFMLLSPNTNTVSIILPGGITFKGTIVNDVASVLPATGVAMNFVTGTAAVGDSIEVFSIDAANYGVRAVTSAPGGITVTP